MLEGAFKSTDKAFVSWAVFAKKNPRPSRAQKSLIPTSVTGEMEIHVCCSSLYNAGSLPAALSSLSHKEKQLGATVR